MPSALQAQGRVRVRTEPTRADAVWRWATTRRSRRVVPVDECPVHSRRANRLAFALARSPRARARPRAGPALDASCVTSSSVRPDDREALVLLVVTRNDKSLRKPLRAFLASGTGPTALFVTVARSRRPVHGRRHGCLRIDGREPHRAARAGPTFLISPTAFFQTNPIAAAVPWTPWSPRGRGPGGTDRCASSISMRAAGCSRCPWPVRGHSVTPSKRTRRP